MLTFEETRVLKHLGSNGLATVAEIARVCLPGGSSEEVARVLWNLEWLGYVVRCSLEAVQITHRGNRLHEAEQAGAATLRTGRRGCQEVAQPLPGVGTLSPKPSACKSRGKWVHMGREELAR
jgi:hypothetical protein